MELRDLNGGFPEPPPGDPVRVVRAAHPACGGEARIRLPGYLPPRAVRRAVCGRCEQSFACERVEELDVAVAPPAVDAGAAPGAPAAEAPRARLPKLPPAQAPVWRWLGIPVAAALVVAALLLLQGGEDASPPVAVGPQEAGTPSGSEAGSGRARFVTEPGFSLALPPGWEATDEEGGAAFTAAASDGTADATLWIESAPGLSFAEFEARSLEQLRSLTGNAKVIERIAAPNTAGTVIRLRADTPAGSGVSAPYDVTLRAAGPYRYYLATTVQPDASVQAREGADLIHGSFVPEAYEGGGRVQTGAPPGSEERAP
jgi:hypothetical protein